MDRIAVRALLAAVRDGEVTVESAADQLGGAVGNLGFAQVDLAREARTGAPEVVYGAGKTAEQIVAILTTLRAAGQTGLVTRVDATKATAVRAALGEGVQFHAVPGILEWPMGEGMPVGRIGVVCAGTSDLPVAEEAAIVAEALGNEVLRVTDVGVAGIHRLLARVEDLRACTVLIVVAGMEGALPGVVAGLVAVPVIGVPTSVGYGTSFGGVSALLTMLNACSAGLAVVNIDSGFGAAMMASRINRLGVARG